MGIAWESDKLQYGVCKELAKLIPDVLKVFCYDNGLDPYPLCIEEFDADEIVEIVMVVFLFVILILISDNNLNNFIISIILVWVRFMRWL